MVINMALDLMYITNKPDVATIAMASGVDKIFIDMEYIGKDERQRGLDTVKSHHIINDVYVMRAITPRGRLLVRINPIHVKTDNYCDTKYEIDEIINAGADIIMLPMFGTVEEVEKFIGYVGGRAKTMLLFETPMAVKNLDDILKVGGIDSVHIGLNDLHLAYGRKFMFELLADGTVDSIIERIRKSGIKYGFGGIARIGYGMLPAEYIIAEHYRLGSSMAILSRSFCNADKITDRNELAQLFQNGITAIRQYEQKITDFTNDMFADNHKQVRKLVEVILKSQN